MNKDINAGGSTSAAHTPDLQGLAALQGVVGGNLSQMVEAQATLLAGQPGLLSNHKTMIENQLAFLKNQERLLSNQPTLLSSQKSMVGNQQALLKAQERLLASQATVLARHRAALNNEDLIARCQAELVAHLVEANEKWANFATIASQQQAIIDRQKALLDS